MQLSVIIVNYNVKHFLDQCLTSVQKAVKNIDSEIIVVDNHSADGSCIMMQQKYPTIKLIANEKNLGFSCANNQAIKEASGEYILLLNPDTIVQEDTFDKIIEFCNTHKDLGGLGVKMIDGNGIFLPESKRGLPSPWVAFYKVFGISKLFPKSPKFNRYHLGYLDKDQVHTVEILSGAFLWFRKEALDKIGLLDETFFMYGEDIDISYRLILGGYKNYYFPETTIVHYKGESTKKSSFNYVKIFYNAMIIFANKHFTQQNAFFYSFLIKLAIYFRAFISLLKRWIDKSIIVILDFLVVYLGFYGLTPWWETHKYANGRTFPDEYLIIVVPIYIITWLLAIYANGGYRRPAKISSILKGVIIGTGCILIAYSLLNEVYRYSRLMILLGGIWSSFSIPVYRLIFHKLFPKFNTLLSVQPKRTLIVSNYKDCTKIIALIDKTLFSYEPLGYVTISDQTNQSYDKWQCLGNINQLTEIISINKADEIILSSESLTSTEIISLLLQLSDYQIEVKIAQAEGVTMIGSNSIVSVGELMTVNLNSIAKPHNRNIKRIFDFVLALLVLGLYVFIFYLFKSPKQLFINCLTVLWGKVTWVGYHKSINEKSNLQLPHLQQSVLSHLWRYKNKKMSAELIDRSNTIYAKDYKFTNDLSTVLNNLKYLDSKYQSI